MIRKVFTFAIVAGALAISACEQTPTAPKTMTLKGLSYITNGDLDGNSHLAVVLIIMDSAGSPAYRCTGTLLAPTVVLTAGHCAGQKGEFSGMRVFTEADVQNGNNNYTLAGPNTVEAKMCNHH